MNTRPGRAFYNSLRSAQSAARAGLPVYVIQKQKTAGFKLQKGEKPFSGVLYVVFEGVALFLHAEGKGHKAVA